MKKTVAAILTAALALVLATPVFAQSSHKKHHKHHKHHHHAVHTPQS
jgi:hypothetical protein